MGSNNKRMSIVSAALAGLLVLAVFLWLADPSSVLAEIQNVEFSLLLIALVPLTMEAMFTTFRVQHCVNHPVSFPVSLYSNSLYIAWLSLLPARLGEIAGIAVFHKKLRMPIGSAIASVVVQRMYDVLILSAMLVGLISQSFYGGQTGLIIATGTLVLLIFVLLTLPYWLGLSAAALLHWRHYAIGKKALYVCLQARTWYRHQSSSTAVFWLTGTTLGKWLVNLTAVIIVFTACSIELSLSQLLTVAILMHFLGAIPIQSFGGFGASDIGLAGVLLTFGIQGDLAVAASITFRLLTLFFVGCFFLFCFVIVRPRLSDEHLSD